MWKGIALIYLLFLSFLDVKEKRVPMAWLALGGGTAVLAAAGQMLTEQTDLLKICLGMLPGALLLIVAALTKKMGCADGFVLLCLGMLAGYRGSIFVLCVSLFLSSFVCVVLLLFQKVGRQTKLAYLPFLTTAYMALWGLGGLGK